MKPPIVIDVDPQKLRLPTTRPGGADPAKLQRQIARYGKSVTGMPPLFVYRGSDDELMIHDGVTRATRVAKLLPGQPVRCEIIGVAAASLGHLPTVGDRLP